MVIFSQNVTLLPAYIASSLLLLLPLYFFFFFCQISEQTVISSLEIHLGSGGSILYVQYIDNRQAVSASKNLRWFNFLQLSLSFKTLGIVSYCVGVEIAVEIPYISYRQYRQWLWYIPQSNMVRWSDNRHMRSPSCSKVLTVMSINGDEGFIWYLSTYQLHGLWLFHEAISSVFWVLLFKRTVRRICSKEDWMFRLLWYIWCMLVLEDGTENEKLIVPFGFCFDFMRWFCSSFASCPITSESKLYCWIGMEISINHQPGNIISPKDCCTCNILIE